MGMLRFASGAGWRLHHLAGSGDIQKGLEHCRHLLGSYQSAAAADHSIGEQAFRFSVHGSSRQCRALSVRALSQLGPAGAILNRTFFQSAIQRKRHVYEQPGGRKKKVAKKNAADKAPFALKPNQRPIVYECGECEAVCVTRILKDPYERGIVIVRCLDCRSVNLISDQLGLFKDLGSMHKFLSERGVDVRNGPEKSYELTPEKLAEIEQLRVTS